MSKSMTAIGNCDKLIGAFEKVIAKPIREDTPVYYTGLDLGTACIVLSVLDEQYRPVAGAYRYADVVKDGMLVDYLGAIEIVRELKQELENKLEAELLYTAVALPPGTEHLDGQAVVHVAQGAGFEVTCVLDEPTAANAVLQISDGAIVDIGGGTTGISIFQDGQVVYTADEPTGGTHFSLVLAGAHKIGLDAADKLKRDPKRHKELLVLLRPVIEKVAMIITQHVKAHAVDEIYLVGGTCCLQGIEDIVASLTGIPTVKPSNPMFVTPLGIAMNCTQEIL